MFEQSSKELKTHSKAWLLSLSDEVSVIIGEQEIVEYRVENHLWPVPKTPNYCSHIIQWQNKLVPVIDLYQLLYSDPLATSQHQSIDKLEITCSVSLGVLVYQRVLGQPLEYLACQLSAPPQRIIVTDDALLSCPTNCPPLLRELAILFVNHKEKTTAILDINKLCSEEFAQLLMTQ
jgi:chemotaxis signal transduction protein